MDETTTAFDIGRMLRAVRRARALSQRDLARLLGVAAGTVGRYESGTRLPTVRFLDRVAQVCGFRLELVDVRVSDADGAGARLRPDDEHDAIRDGRGRRFPAHLHWGGKPNLLWCHPRWWGWRHIAWYDGDPATPEHIYWTRRNADGTPWDQPWAPMPPW
ncbi:helix-turn-helix domain-containing protein [Jatrophihabitans fulvus]